MIRATWVGSAVLALTMGASAFADDAAESCRKAPTRACVLEAAAAAADKVGMPFVKANLLALVARDQHYDGLDDAGSASLARAVEVSKQISANNDLGPTAPGLVGARAAFGDTAAALALARGIDNPMSRSFALAGVAMAFQRHGKNDDANATFALAIATAQAAPADQRGFALTQIAYAESRVGLPDAAATFDRALAASDPKAGRAGANFVISQRIKAGDFARAYIAIGDLPESSRNFLLTNLVAAAANAGDIDAAVAAESAISNGSDQMRAMANLAVAEFRAGNAMAGAQWIVKTQAQADRETTAGVKAEAEADIAGAESVAGMTLRAQGHMADARAAMDLSAIDEVFRRSIVHATARALARAGDPAAALDLLRNRIDPKIVIGDLVDIAADLGATRSWGAAFEVLQAIPADDQRAGALIEFAAKLPS